MPQGFAGQRPPVPRIAAGGGKITEHEKAAGAESPLGHAVCWPIMNITPSPDPLHDGRRIVDLGRPSRTGVSVSRGPGLLVRPGRRSSGQAPTPARHGTQRQFPCGGDETPVEPTSHEAAAGVGSRSPCHPPPAAGEPYLRGAGRRADDCRDSQIVDSHERAVHLGGERCVVEHLGRGQVEPPGGRPGGDRCQLDADLREHSRALEHGHSVCQQVAIHDRERLTG